MGGKCERWAFPQRTTMNQTAVYSASIGRDDRPLYRKARSGCDLGQHCCDWPCVSQVRVVVESSGQRRQRTEGQHGQRLRSAGKGRPAFAAYQRGPLRSRGRRPLGVHPRDRCVRLSGVRWPGSRRARRRGDRGGGRQRQRRHRVNDAADDGGGARLQPVLADRREQDRSGKPRPARA